MASFMPLTMCLMSTPRRSGTLDKKGRGRGEGEAVHISARLPRSEAGAH